MEKVFIDVHRKISLLGDVGVGKSCLVERYMTGKFNEYYDPTIENTSSRVICVGSKVTRIHLNVVDTAGINDYSSSLTRNSSLGINCFIFVFSITSAASFEKVKVVYDLLLSTLGGNPQVPFLLCGTMCDLKDQRAVTTQQGLTLAKTLGAQYMECSSKTGSNIDVLFNEALRLIDIDMDTTSCSSDQPDAKRTSCTIM